MSAITARLSAGVVAALVAVSAACADRSGRVAGVAESPVVRLGTFEQRGVSFLAGLLSAEALVSVDWNGRPIYRLLESAVESSDGSMLTLRLRSDMKFHNGDPVSADRVRQLLLEPALARGQVAEIESKDDRTLVIRLRRAGFFQVVDLYDYFIEDPKDHQVRTGPFRLRSEGPPAVLEPFREYHLGVPTVSRLEIRPYQTHRAAWTAMLRGEVNFLHEVSRDAIGFLEAGGSIKVYPALRPYVVSLVFNLKHPILSRQDVRIALAEAIEREEVVRNGMRGHGEIAEGPFWPHHWAYSPDRNRSKHNPEAAALRLDSVDLPVKPVGPNRMPSRFRFVCLIREDDPRFERMALVVQRQLYAIGVDMQLQTVSLSGLETRLRTGDYDAFLIEMVTGRTLSAPYRWWHSPNPTGYSAADSALDRMKLARADDDVRAAVGDVIRILRADPPAVFLAHPREARAIDRAFEIPYEPDRDVIGMLWQLRRASQVAERTR